MFLWCECCVLSGSGLCDEQITRPEESYRLWGIVCDLETWLMTKKWPELGRSTKKKGSVKTVACTWHRAPTGIRYRWNWQETRNISCFKHEESWAYSIQIPPKIIHVLRINPFAEFLGIWPTAQRVHSVSLGLHMLTFLYVQKSLSCFSNANIKTNPSINMTRKAEWTITKNGWNIQHKRKKWCMDIRF